MSTPAPYGSWPSPYTVDRLADATVRLGGPYLAAGDIWWAEQRPNEGGRTQILRRGAHGRPVEQLPEGYSARSFAHEYGGGAWWLHGEMLFFVNDTDQRIWRINRAGALAPLTPEPPTPRAHRYADGRVTADGRWILCVRERHDGDGEVHNDLVGVRADLDGEPDEPTVLWSGPDFVSNPRTALSDDYLCWLQWDLPNMPWDSTELWIAGLNTVGDELTLDQPERVLGSAGVSLAQPEWGPAGHLHVVSDANGWWNLWAFPRPGRPSANTAQQVTRIEAELVEPQWVFGQSRYCFTPTGHLVGAWRFGGVDHLGLMRRDTWGEVTWVDTGYTSLSGLCSGDGSEIAMLAASFEADQEVVSIDVDLLSPDRRSPFAVRRPPHDLDIDVAWVSQPEPISFPSAGGRTAHGLFFAPNSPDHVGPEGELPPLLVLSHGGPTAAARPHLQPAIQAFTSRGWAVVDVNYGGSTGYGRAYRELLNGAWGVVDVEDCTAAARWLADQGRVDPARMAIKGGSAGGFTTLSVLASSDVFAVGSSHYGVADLEALARDTHKFESRYLDTLVGPYPEAAQTYRDRSPIHHADALSCPVILLQGAEDTIVPLNQAEMMADAVRAKGLPVALVVFEGEHHGFRQAATIRRAIEAELYFFARVLGFTPADDLAAVDIDNL